MSGIMMITGAGRGIGRATAILAAQSGYDVCINYVHDQAAAEATCAECAEAGVAATMFQANVADQAQVAALFAHCDNTLGPVSALIKNAGVIGQASKLVDLAALALLETFDINVHGAIYCSQEAIRRMSTRLGGKGDVIVNITSIAAVTGSPNEYIHYAASKAALETLTIGLAKEVGPEGIRVNGVRAGSTATDIHARSGNPDRPAIVAQMAPLRRVAEPEEMAEAALWLASDKASYANGAILGITGGL
jgi:NAD(P)-dependent dehydrogenase (short-subunit alcohol dehydrogenase family)